LLKLVNDGRRRDEDEREKEKEKGGERKPIAFSPYHHCRSFACLVSTSLLNSCFFFNSQYTCYHKCLDDFSSQIFYDNSFKLVKKLLEETREERMCVYMRMRVCNRRCSSCRCQKKSYCSSSLY
jgi:hypothetical protein